MSGLACSPTDSVPPSQLVGSVKQLDEMGVCAVGRGVEHWSDGEEGVY